MSITNKLGTKKDPRQMFTTNRLVIGKDITNRLGTKKDLRPMFTTSINQVTLPILFLKITGCNILKCKCPFTAVRFWFHKRYTTICTASL